MGMLPWVKLERSRVRGLPIEDSKLTTMLLLESSFPAVLLPAATFDSLLLTLLVMLMLASALRSSGMAVAENDDRPLRSLVLPVLLEPPSTEPLRVRLGGIEGALPMPPPLAKTAGVAGVIGVESSSSLIA